MIPKRPRQEEDNVDSWLMSYADMITLLLAFFVVFIATSEPKRDKFVEATQGLRAQFGVIAFETPFDGLYKNLVGVVAEQQADKNISVIKSNDSVQMELASLAFFEPGSAEVRENELPTLQKVAEMLKGATLTHYSIVVEAHTSPATKPDKAYASAWELSSARAATVVRMLAEAGVDASRMSAVGMAATQPMVPNVDAKGGDIPENQARNERVLVKVMR